MSLLISIILTVLQPIEIEGVTANVFQKKIKTVERNRFYFL